LGVFEEREGAGEGVEAPAGRQSRSEEEVAFAAFALELGFRTTFARDRSLEKAEAGLEGRRAPEGRRRREEVEEKKKKKKKRSRLVFRLSIQIENKRKLFFSAV